MTDQALAVSPTAKTRTKSKSSTKQKPEPISSYLPQIEPDLAALTARLPKHDTVTASGSHWRWAGFDLMHSAEGAKDTSPCIVAKVNSDTFTFELSHGDWTKLDGKLAPEVLATDVELVNLQRCLALSSAVEVFRTKWQVGLVLPLGRVKNEAVNSEASKILSNLKLSASKNASHNDLTPKTTPSERAEFALQFEVLHQDQVVTGKIYSTLANWHKLLGKTAPAVPNWKYSQNGVTKYGQTPIQVELQVATMNISFAALKTWEKGDLVKPAFLETPQPVSKIQQIRLNWRKYQAICTINNQGQLSMNDTFGEYASLTDISEDSFEEGSVEMADSENSNIKKFELTHVIQDSANITCKLNFNLGAITMTLDELAALKKGDVIALNQPVNPAEVMISSAGKLIGKGQLAVVADNLVVILAQI